MIVSKTPNECTANELQDFTALVLAGGEVTAVGLETRIKKAKALLFLQQSDCLKGIAAVKHPESSYKERAFKKAHATEKADQFPFELGWVFVLPSLRGAGFSHKLVESALAVANGQAMFATSRADNTPMHKTLEKHGFMRHGKAYASNRGNQQLVLFVRSPTQQDAPGDEQ
ncbi:MAG: GNAT family N-acetyltransferase [Methylosarcina sp.]